MLLSQILFPLLLMVATGLSTPQNPRRAPSISLCTHAVVLGAVNRPGYFEVKGTTDVLDLIKRAGGFSELAGESIQVTRFQVAADCENFTSQKTRTYKIKDLEHIKVEVQAGDGVGVSFGDIVTVIGPGEKAQSVALKRGTRLTELLHATDALKDSSPQTRVSLMRLPSKGGRPSIRKFLLRSLEARPRTDPVLLAGDFIEISDASGAFNRRRQ